MISLLPLFIILILFSGVVIPVTKTYGLKNPGKLLAILPLIVFALLLHELLNLGPRELALLESGWGFMNGMEFTFRIDGLSLIFGLMISGIGTLILLYASFYMKKYQRKGHFFTYLMVFMGSMLGMVLTDNLMVLFMFWELTSVASFFLIGFDHHLEKPRQSALQALLITGFGGLCLLFATILIGHITGTYRISELLDSSIHLGNHPYYYLMLGLVLLAAITKSAQFPFHFWLPGAMNAPTPVSAYLHSATMVNAGIFLLLRLHPIMGGTFIWRYVLILLGGITMFIGAFLALGERDLKRILAFTTISALGTMTLLIGIDTSQSLKAALLFFIIHGLYKGGLFMIAGIIEKSTGSRDIYNLGGLFRPLPLTAIATFLAVISMAGLPPMLGFIGKELIYEAKLQLQGLNWILIPLGVGANIFMVGISIIVFFELFIKRRRESTPAIKYRERDFPWSFLSGPLVLAVSGLLLGIAPRILEIPMANGLYYVQSQMVKVNLGLWHGFNDVLVLSIFTILSGILVFLLRRPITAWVSKISQWLNIYHLPSLFTNLINKYLKTATKNTDRIQHGYHRYYLMTFFLVTVALASIHLFDVGDFTQTNFSASPIRLHIILLLTVASIAVLFAVYTKSRLSAILSMGIVGYGIGLLYLYYGAIDLAITQFLAETILLVLFVMVIYYLPDFAVLSSKASRIRDGIISLVVGVFITLIVLKANFINIEVPVSDFFSANALTKAHGRNIVNVILVDFRALDTLGEITVLTLAAAGVYSLFRFQIKNLKNKNDKPLIKP
jgi:multicomponent Na+:H+ antiporter subunit A